METIDVWKTFFRDRAVAKWLTVAEYDKIIEDNPREDREIEEETKQFVENCTWNVIVSRRMWFYILPDITSVWLDVSQEQWAERVFLADRWKQEPKYTTIQEALVSSQSRMSKLRQRLLNVYGVDFTDISHYTKVIDTTDKTQLQVLQEFEEYMKTLKK